MKKKNMIILCSFIFVFIVGIVVFNVINKTYPLKDENTLYYKVFDKDVLRYERTDYALGQNQLVVVEKRDNKGESFESITNEPIIVSKEGKYNFLDEKLGFVITKPNLTKSNNYLGFRVTHDGGKTFEYCIINYDNPKIDILTMESLPYYENKILKVKASIYIAKDDQSGYEDRELIFISKDKGITWNLEE